MTAEGDDIGVDRGSGIDEIDHRNWPLGDGQGAGDLTAPYPPVILHLEVDHVEAETEVIEGDGGFISVIEDFVDGGTPHEAIHIPVIGEGSTECHKFCVKCGIGRDRLYECLGDPVDLQGRVHLHRPVPFVVPYLEEDDMKSVGEGRDIGLVLIPIVEFAVDAAAPDIGDDLTVVRSMTFEIQNVTAQCGVG